MRGRPARLETLQYVVGIGYYKNVLRRWGPQIREQAMSLSLVETVEGDTWWALSQRTGVPILLLRMYNPFLAPRPIRAGNLVAYPAPESGFPISDDGTYQRKEQIGPTRLASQGSRMSQNRRSDSS